VYLKADAFNEHLLLVARHTNDVRVLHAGIAVRETLGLATRPLVDQLTNWRAVSVTTYSLRNACFLIGTECQLTWYLVTSAPNGNVNYWAASAIMHFDFCECLALVSSASSLWLYRVIRYTVVRMRRRTSAAAVRPCGCDNWPDIRHLVLSNTVRLLIRFGCSASWNNRWVRDSVWVWLTDHVMLFS
jgi:hypothetical protein